tara:strand:+ start:3479 stop:3817 length:339 start_codon:yes stop_codon:yes gene_type:complete
MTLKNTKLDYQYIKNHFNEVSQKWETYQGNIVPTLAGYINHVNDVAEGVTSDEWAVELADQKITHLMDMWLEIRGVIRASQEKGITTSNNAVIDDLFKKSIEVFQSIINKNF